MLDCILKKGKGMRKVDYGVGKWPWQYSICGSCQILGLLLSSSLLLSYCRGSSSNGMLQKEGEMDSSCGTSAVISI